MRWWGGCRKVVLRAPAYAGLVGGPPLGLLSLAASLREAGFEPKIVDGALDRDYQRTVLKEIPESLCFGISLLTGPMIRDAIEMSRLVREIRPDVPIVYGGWHPSLLTAETLRDPAVERVGPHQGGR